VTYSIGFQPLKRKPRLDDVAWCYVLRRALAGSGLTLVDEGFQTTGSAPKVLVHDPSTYRRVMMGGSVALGLTYAAGWWDADDLVGVLRVLARRIPVRRRPALKLPLPEISWALPRNRQDKARDRLDVQAHYDLGDEFFSLFLDPTMTYSCAYFDHQGMSLEQASTAKLNRICDLAELSPDDDVMEIGTGWGSFALHSAETRGCHVTTTTVSERQRDFAYRHVAEADLSDKISVLDLDYRDLVGEFDKLVSIEMVEAVGWQQMEQYFSKCAEILRPGGLFALQAIVIDERFYETAKHREDFVKRIIFPGLIQPVGEAVSGWSSATTLGSTTSRPCRDGEDDLSRTPLPFSTLVSTRGSYACGSFTWPIVKRALPNGESATYRCCSRHPVWSDSEYLRPGENLGGCRQL
jgi:cyclopropane-fatty-acyl-phospholipid synthase